MLVNTPKSQKVRMVEFGVRMVEFGARMVEF